MFDLGAEVGLGVDELARDAGVAGDRRERERTGTDGSFMALTVNMRLTRTVRRRALRSRFVGAMTFRGRLVPRREVVRDLVEI